MAHLNFSASDHWLGAHDGKRVRDYAWLSARDQPAAPIGDPRRAAPGKS